MAIRRTRDQVVPVHFFERAPASVREAVAALAGDRDGISTRPLQSAFDEAHGGGDAERAQVLLALLKASHVAQSSGRPPPPQLWTELIEGPEIALVEDVAQVDAREAAPERSELRQKL